MATALLALGVRPLLSRMRLGVCLLKGIYGLLGALWFVDSIREQLGYLLPWSWLLLLPVNSQPDSDRRDTFPRLFLCLLAIWEGLQAYPAAGTQAVLATFLLVAVCSLCLNDAITGLATEPAVSGSLESLSNRTRLLLSGLALTSLLYEFAVKWCTPQFYWRLYASQPALELPGSRLLRVPESQADVYRELTKYLKAECDTFATIPGFNSLYFWTEKSPPNYFNLTEVILLNDGQQDQIVAALKKARRPLVVWNEQRVPFVLGPELTRDGPLVRFVRDECHEIKRVGTFVILAPNSIAPDRGPSSVHSVP